ncbi:MAG: gliding motility-associated C-terminal domain-containing protein, partial [Bacteroidia bacterium]|nr:gliding motility-associated C-terminal domain-containing protein [Bacteroidia bacterium]
EINIEVATTDALCNGAGGTATYTLEGGCEPLTCEVRNADSGGNFVGCDLITSYDSGNWEIRVTDAVGTTATLSFTIGLLVDEPLALNIISVTGASCTSNGSVDLDISGGCNPVCVITDILTAQTYDCDDSLPAGDYAVRVEDDLGTVRTANFTIEDETNVNPLTPDVSSNDALCFGEFGSATLNYSGGCEPVSVTLFDNDGNELTGNNGSQLLAGTYMAVFTDNVGTSASQSFTIVQPNTAVTVNLESNIDGNVDISITGGAGGYTYLWTSPTGMTFDTQDLNGLTQGGTYQVVVTDSNGCTGSLDVFVPGTGVVLSNVFVATDFGGFGTPCAPTTIPCTGEAVISGNIEGGTAPYTITLDDGTNQSTYDGFPIMDVCAGSYDLSVTDANGDMILLPGGIEVTSPEPIEIVLDEITCADLGETNGSISTFVSGGVGGYSYEWSPGGPDAPNNPNVNIGMYILEVIDDFDCTAEMLFEVEDCEGPTSECYEGISVMTPNGDGFNEFLVITCANNNPNTLSIYDRWGRVVYETTNYNNTWSGIDLDGELLNEGAYYWVMEVLFNNGDSRIMKGTVTLLRNE